MGTELEEIIFHACIIMSKFILLYVQLKKLIKFKKISADSQVFISQYALEIKVIFKKFPISMFGTRGGRILAFSRSFV